jgi:hypothetical protein
MNRRNGGNRQHGQPAKNRLAQFDQAAQIFRRQIRQSVKICPGNKDGVFRAGQNQPSYWVGPRTPLGFSSAAHLMGQRYVFGRFPGRASLRERARASLEKYGPLEPAALLAVAFWQVRGAAAANALAVALVPAALVRLLPVADGKAIFLGLGRAVLIAAVLVSPLALIAIGALGARAVEIVTGAARPTVIADGAGTCRRAADYTPDPDQRATP